jgi:hypothetical protein
MLAAIGAALIGLAQFGCAGYRLGSSLPADMRSVFIPMFVNESQEPLIEVEATNAAIAEFQRDGTLRIAPEDAADLILECRLVDVTLDPLRYSKADRKQPNEYRLSLHALVVLKRSGSNQVVSRQSLVGESTFPFTGNLAGAKRNAVPEAARDLAKRIVENVVETWW